MDATPRTRSRLKSQSEEQTDDLDIHQRDQTGGRMNAHRSIEQHNAARGNRQLLFQSQPEVVILDDSDEEDDGDSSTDSYCSDSSQKQPGSAAKVGINSRAALTAVVDGSELIISDSQEDFISDSEGAACIISSSQADDIEDTDTDDAEGSLQEATAEAEVQLHRRLRHDHRATAATAAAPQKRPTSSRSQSMAIPNRRASLRSTASPARVAQQVAAATPRRSTRKPQVPPGITPPHVKAAAACEATPASSRPVRSCTRPGAAAGSSQPSLATPLGKLSLSSSLTPAKSPRRSCGTTPAAAAAGSKRSRSKAKSSSNSPAVGDRLPYVVVDDEAIAPGNDVYLVQDEYDPDQEDEEEACEVCHSSNSSKSNAILECSTCLRGFHQRCLKPVLKAVPEGDWLCPECNAGQQPPPPAQLLTRWQKLLHGENQLALVHVVDAKRGRAPDGTEENQLLVRYYKKPEETHLGRQRHHGARELFLGAQVYVEPAQAFAGHAYVHPPHRFAEVHEEEGNDVFLCEFEYNETLKTFKARRYHHHHGTSRGGNALAADDVHLADPLSPAGAGGLSRGRHSRCYNHDTDSSSGCSSEYEACSDDECDESYRPDLGLHIGSLKGWKGGKRRRQHGQLPANAVEADRFAGLGAADIAQHRADQAQQGDAFSRLHTVLSLGSVPASLPCREEERARLKTFVNRALTEDGGVLYICGVPGTGKTALVMEVLGGVREAGVQAGAQVVAINCLQLPSPQHVFSRLWEKLSGQHLGPARAREALMQLFGVAGGGSRRRYSTIIVLDEIDMLMTRDQAVLYQLFDWPHHPGSRLAVIGISNTHDLDQRVLPRIASRLDQAKLAFAPYNVQQLLTIVNARLQKSGVGGAVEEVAVQLACRKVAAETGDVRRALELLRRGVEIARQQHFTAAAVAAKAAGGSSTAAALPQQQTTVVKWQEGQPALLRRMQVQQAQHEMFGALHLQLLRSRSTWEKILLVAVVVEARATGRSAVVIQKAAERAASSICQLVDLAPPTLGVLQHCLVRLAGARLLLGDGTHIKAHVALNVDKDDVALVIREDERLKQLHHLV